MSKNSTWISHFPTFPPSTHQTPPTSAAARSALPETPGAAQGPGRGHAAHRARRRGAAEDGGSAPGGEESVGASQPKFTNSHEMIGEAWNRFNK